MLRPMKSFPRLAPGVRLQPGPDARHRLIHEEMNTEVVLGDLEMRVLSQLDGGTPLSELERGLAMLTGQALRQGTVRRLVQRLGELGFVELPADPPLHWLPEERVRCDASGACCHLRVGPLHPLDLDRLLALPWDLAGVAAPNDPLVDDQGLPWSEDRASEALHGREAAGEGAPPALFLRRGDDGACCFLEPDGRCRIHATFGHDAKPAICRVFPLQVVELAGELRVGANLRCPGTCRAGAASPLDAEIARHGDLLRRGPQEGLALSLGLPGTAAAAAPRAAALEPELLELLASEGATVDQALALALRRVRAEVSDLGAGGSLSELRHALAGVVQDELPRLPCDGDRQSVGGLLDLIQRLAARADERELDRVPLSRRADELLRRSLRQQLFLRQQLYRWGLLRGLALAALLHLLARLGAAELALAEGHPAVGPDHVTRSLHVALWGVPLLGELESLPGLGARCLDELEQRLDELSAAAE